MKKFTKIVLIITGILAVIAAVCIIIAACMGAKWVTVQDMIFDGKFSFKFVDGFEIGIFDTDRGTITSDPVTITEEIENLDVEFGAGKIEICYGDVEGILIEPQGVAGFSTKVKDKTLHIEGGLGISGKGNGNLIITLPQGMVLEKADFEIGASAATMTGLRADELKIEVGAGEATLTQLDVLNLKAEVGVGELNVGLVGAQTDYSYKLECGIGEVKFGGNSYGGFGTSHNVQQPDADRMIDVECGIGEVEIVFEK